MAHANRGCKWYINKPLLSQAKLTAEENVHAHTTVPLIEWTEIKILLPRAISGGLWKRNCNKFMQKQLNQLQTGQQTRWQGGNRGVSIKKQSYVWHAAKLWQNYTWNWRKAEKNPCITVRLWMLPVLPRAALQTKSSRAFGTSKGPVTARTPQEWLSLEEHFPDLGLEQLWVLLQRLRDHKLQTTLSGEAGGKKEIPTLAEQGEKRLEKYSVHHLKDPSNRNTESGCK